MPETIGRRLRKAREDLHITLERASETTRIRAAYLRALEEDDYSVMPSPAQGRGFLRNYAQYLGLNLEEVLQEIKQSKAEAAEISGPLPSVDAVPEVQVEEEKPSPPFWTRILPRRNKADSAAEAESVQALAVEAPAETERTAEPVASESKPVKARGRKKAEAQPAAPARGKKKAKKEEAPPAIAESVPAVVIEEERASAETQSVEAEQAEVADEAQSGESKGGWFARLASVFSVRIASSRKSPAEEIETVVAPQAKAKVAVPAQTAEEIFESLGRELRRRRETISLTLEEVERHTRLRAVFLQALEDGALDKLPSPVQTRGMLSNYASFLDLDADAILLRFADVLQARHRSKYPEKPRAAGVMPVAPAMPPLRGFIAGDLIFGVLMSALLIGLGVWGVGRLIDRQSQSAVPPTAPSISEVLGGTPQPTRAQEQEVTFIPAVDTPFAAAVTQQPLTASETPALTANVRVIVTVVERAFMRAAVDGKVVFDGRVQADDAFTFDAENQVYILTGNGAALRITYNGRDLGLMGNFGQVVSHIYTITGLATATVTLSPTPTATSPITNTPTPTAMPTPTPGGTPTP